mgnify:CR=1 FL=1|jgi:paraquat-inducible protein B
MKKANPKAVGGFVLGAILLAIVVILVFGGGKFFEEREKFVVYFPGSLQGLRVGAPVEISGVQVGTVTNIAIRVNKDLKFTFPVVFETVRGQVEGITDQMMEKVTLDDLIAKGLRAQLVATSFVTGQQSIQLVFLPDTPVILTENDYPYDQVPSLPSAAEKIKGSLEEAAEQASKVLARINEFMTDENRDKIEKMILETSDAISEIGPTLESFQTAAETMNETLKDFQEEGEPLSDFLTSGEATMKSYKALAERADGMLVANEENIQRAIAGMISAEQKLSRLSDTANAMIEENRRGMREFSESGLAEISNMAIDAQGAIEQFRRVMEEMERDPARFFLGGPGTLEVQ